MMLGLLSGFFFSSRMVYILGEETNVPKVDEKV